MGSPFSQGAWLAETPETRHFLALPFLSIGLAAKLSTGPYLDLLVQPVRMAGFLSLPPPPSEACQRLQAARQPPPRKAPLAPLFLQHGSRAIPRHSGGACKPTSVQGLPEPPGHLQHLWSPARWGEGRGHLLLCRKPELLPGCRTLLLGSPKRAPCPLEQSTLGIAWPPWISPWTEGGAAALKRPRILAAPRPVRLQE